MRYKRVITPSDMYARFGAISKNPTCYLCYCTNKDTDSCDHRKRDKLEELLGCCTPDSGIYHFELDNLVIPNNILVL
jgi:hypothetical protein